MTREMSFCVFTTHQVAAEDATPLRIVSEARLAQLLAIEVAYTAMAAIIRSIDPMPAQPAQVADG